MIYVIYGPGGSGKSRFQVQVIADKLRETRQNVVTNLALDVPRLAEYLEQKFPRENLRVTERVRVLTDAETRYFWRYRGPVVWTGHEYEMQEDKGTHGVCYIVDEAGAAGFSAKAWASMGDSRTPRGIECAAYLDQQRKHSDDVYFSTNGRNPNRICKDVRDVAHYFIRLRNEYLAQYGIFRGRGRFTAKMYDHEPEKSSTPIRQIDFHIDEQGLASCYRTEQGVGVTGTTHADKGARAKGISIWWAIPGAFALVSLIFFIPQWMGSLAGGYVSKSKAPKAQATQANTENTTLRPREAQASSTQSNPLQPNTFRQEEPEVYIRGYVKSAGKHNILLSDGRLLREGDGQLQTVITAGRNVVAVVNGGKRYYQKEPPKTTQAQQHATRP